MAQAALQFSVLGPMRLAIGERIVKIDSPKQRLLMAALLVNTPRAVSFERLAEVLWPDELPADPMAALQVHVSRVRGSLAASGASDALVTEPYGYRLATDGCELDAARFEDLVNEARRSRDARAALELLDAALGLWRGVAFAEFAEHSFARREAARLEELKVAALEQRAEVLIELGLLDDARTLLDRLVADQPLRERPRDQLMRVLYRSGRQADALAVAREFRQLMASELGLDPSPAFVDLEERVLRHELAGAGHGDGGRAAGSAPRPLPAPQLQISFVTAGRGRIAVGRAGSGPVLVVLPGFVSNLEVMANGRDPRSPLLGLLAERFHLVTYDRCGTGMSRGKVHDHSVEASAAELADILDALDLCGVAVLAISCAGPIAVTLAHRRPELVSHLVCLGTYADGPRSFGGPVVTESILNLVRAHWGLGSKLLTDLMYPCATADFSRWFAKGQRDAATTEDAASYLDAMFNADVSGLLADLQLPSLVIHYTGDRAIPFRGAQDLAAGLCGAQFVPLGGSLHLPEGEDAGRVTGLIEDFLTRSGVGVDDANRLASVS